MDAKGAELKPIPRGPVFRLFTRESITKISKRIQEEKLEKEAAKEQEKLDKENGEEKKDKDKDDEDEDKPAPNPALAQGAPLPQKMSDFPPEMYGMPIEDIDEYYQNQYTFVVIAKDKTIFRFSSDNGFFFLSPWNPIRRTAILVLTHPLFSLSVMLVILVNCVFMAINEEIPHSETIFTVIYTVEGSTKMLARGFILSSFTYLRDAWNWLDFIVVSSAYLTMALGEVGGKVAVLRTFRVFRALKTVAVVPGLKTIVGALMEAVKRLRDVMILSLFVLSIFALIGLQLYQGSLMRKCVKIPDYLVNGSKLEKRNFSEHHREAWQDIELSLDGKICGGSKCDVQGGYECVESGFNPNYGYTNYDSFPSALLCAFRLMTQDYWENLYQLTIKANGQGQMSFFVIVIFLGSFYLVNLILAIVAMAYDDCRRDDAEAAELERAEAEEQELYNLQQAEAADAALLAANDMNKSPSDMSNLSVELYVPKKVQPTDKECISMKSECAVENSRRRLSVINSFGKKASTSLPGSPFTIHRGSQFSWRRQLTPTVQSNDRRPLVLPCLENLDLPYADDSAAVTPTSEELCNFQNAQNYLTYRQRLSLTSYGSRMSQLETRFAATSRKASYVSHQSRYSPHMLDLPKFRIQDKKCEPTHFHWTTSARHRAQRPTTELIVGRTKADDMGNNDWEKGKLFPDNPFIYRTPSNTTVDIKDVLVLKDLIKGASGKKNFLGMEEGQSKKEFFKIKCHQILFGWECCSCWYKFAHIIELFIMDAFVDLFITLCIVINTLFMAMDHNDMSQELTNTLKYGNYVFTCIFTVEAGLKILALGLYKYLEDKWSCFDIVIVILSLVELGLSGVKGLSILRSFRLLRVFKLAKSWPTLNLLIGIIGRTMGALGNLCFVLAIIVFIFAVMGMQLFGPNYTPEKFVGTPVQDTALPGWHFKDFLHAFMIVFRVLCGEWIESMWDCLYCSSWVCIPFFLLTMIIGNLVVLNLFLALLLSSFGAESLKHTEEEEGPNKLQEAVDRINRFVIYVKSHATYCIKVKFKQKVDALHDCDSVGFTKHSGMGTTDGGIQFGNGHIRDRDETSTERLNNQDSPQHYNEPDDDIKEIKENHMKMDQSLVKIKTEASGQSLDNISCASSSSSSSTDSNGSQKSMLSNSSYSYSMEDITSTGKAHDGPEIHEVKVVFIKYPDECCPKCCSKKCGCFAAFDRTMVGRYWGNFRFFMFKLVENNYFETFIIIMIVTSSLALAVEDVDIELPDRLWLKKTLFVMDKLFTVIFVCEMVIKMSAYGWKKYFTDAWCWLDFIIVVISLLSLGAESAGYGNIGAFRALRTLRALRPLRAVSRWEGMKVVVNALIQAIPAIFNVLLVCLVFWLIFSIMGVNLFGGKYFKCLDADGNRVNYSIIQNKTQCENLAESMNYTWFNPKINFDNVLIGYLALFQVATFKGWIDIMYDAINSQSDNHQQPVFEHRSGMYLYFVFFIVFGSFFTLNLFIGVIIENFNMQKKKAGGSLEMLMTEDQKKYYNAMKKLGSKQPQKPIPKPKAKCQLILFYITSSQKFDIFIMLVILLNMMTMAIETYDQTEFKTNILFWVNQFFVIVFTGECIMKLLSLRQYYFKQPWNVFDFVVVISSVLTSMLTDQLENLPISPTLLRVVRVFRVGRILRLVKSAKGIRTLLFSLAVSMPALFNIGLLLFLVMFIYSIFGMSFFMHVKHTKGIDDIFNFETFFHSFILLFQISTSAGWDGVLAGLMNEEECNATSTDIKPNGDCGNSGQAVVYLVTYLVISFLVVINMYIAVILENFSQATEDVQKGLTQDDFDMYYEVWERFDEGATQYIDLTQLSEFVDSLEEPLRLPAPNLFKLVSFDIPICDDDKIHCVDILDALTKNFLGTVDTGGDLGEIQKGPERKNYHPISSMLKRQREVFVVRVIQRTWRNYVKRKHGITDEEVEKTDDKTETIITIDDPDKEVEKLSEKPEENLSPSAGDDFKTVELFAESEAVV